MGLTIKFVNTISPWEIIHVFPKEKLCYDLTKCCLNNEVFLTKFITIISMV